MVRAWATPCFAGSSPAFHAHWSRLSAAPTGCLVRPVGEAVLPITMTSLGRGSYAPGLRIPEIAVALVARDTPAYTFTASLRGRLADRTRSSHRLARGALTLRGAEAPLGLQPGPTLQWADRIRQRKPVTSCVGPANLKEQDATRMKSYDVMDCRITTAAPWHGASPPPLLLLGPFHYKSTPGPEEVKRGVPKSYWRR